MIEQAKEWQQLVSKVNEAYSTTDGVPPSVNSVSESDMEIPPEGKRNYWAKKYNMWIGILYVLGRKLKENLLRKKVRPKVSLAERTSQLTIYQNRKPRVCNHPEYVCN